MIGERRQEPVETGDLAVEPLERAGVRQLVRLDPGEHRPADAAAAQDADQLAGVDALDAGDVVGGQEIVEGALLAPVVAVGGEFTDDQGCDPGAARFDIDRVGAVVVDQRVGQGDDLTPIGGVGGDLLVAGHAGVEH